MNKYFQKLIPNKVLSNFGYTGIRPKSFVAQNLDIREDIATKYAYDGDLLDIFASNQGPLVHKWHHYIPLYDRYFGQYRNQPIKFLEIGVAEGGSLKMWRRYFGNDAVIFGIDIDPACLQFNNPDGRVRIGSQVDKEFLLDVIDEMGGVDIVLDDGSHHMQDIRTSFDYLYPMLNLGGTYIVEDLHTSYWRRYGGGYGMKKNFFNFVRDSIDDMHRWYHENAIKNSAIAENCSGIHIHDSMVVFEKKIVYQPVSSKVG